MQYEEKYFVQLETTGGWEDLNDFDVESHAWSEFDYQADLRKRKGESYSLRVIRKTQVTIGVSTKA